MNFNKFTEKSAIAFLRLAMGWLFFYSGITKIMSGDWSAEGYLKSAESFTGIYHWFASPGILPLINFLNEWGQLFIGISLLLGIFVRWSTIFGILMMLLYYFALPFPFPNPQSFIVDQHIIYALALGVLHYTKAGQFLGIDKFRSSRKLF